MRRSPDARFGTLRLVGTPIGNRDDLAPRARKALSGASLVACEDTRAARRLFSMLELPSPELVVYHDHNAEAAVPRVIERLEAGDDVVVISEAGMPAIQDPGYRLVVAARELGIVVVPVPGPSALVLALAASGLPTDRFAFLGYAARKGRERWWREALARRETVVAYESPRRVAATLTAIARIAPERRTCLAREITKLHEEFVTDVAAALAERIVIREGLRGECVLVVEGSSADASTEAVPWGEALAALRETRAGRAMSGRDLVDVLATAYPGARNAIYDAVHAGREEA